MKAILFLLSVSVVTLATAEKKSYHNYKLLSIIMRSESDAAVVRQAEELGGDLWSQVLYKDAYATMLVSPELLDTVVQLFASKGLTFWVSNENLQRAIDQEHEDNMKATRGGSVVGTYARYADIESWLKTKAGECGNNCVLETIGRSYENRNIYAFRFGKNIKTGINLPRIFTESTLHAREWLAQAAHIYIIDELIAKFGLDEAITNAFSRVEITFVVVANPDGYEFSHTTDRMWRKTRSLNPGSICLGVDPNRNFDFHHCRQGASSNPCTQTYCGTRPYSEPETLALSNYILGIKSTLKAYIAQHTNCQMILVPYGYKYNEFPPDYDELVRVGNAMASAMKAATNTVYTVGNSADLLGTAAGASDDWAKAVAGAKYSYTLELRPVCDPTGAGFLASPTEIVPAGTELLAGLITLANNIN